MIKIKLNNPRVDWYFQNIHPKLSLITRREVAKTDPKDLAMTRCLLTFVK